MRVEYNVNANCKIVAETKGVKETFQFLSYADTVFGQKRCGNCESENLSFQYRTPQGYEYYSVKCNDCRHEMKFGQQQNEAKTLFPKGWEPPFSGDGESDSGGRGDRKQSRGERKPSRTREDDHADSYYDSEPAYAAGDGIDF